MFLFSKDKNTRLTNFGRFFKQHLFEILHKHFRIDMKVRKKHLALGILNLDLHLYLLLIKI